MISMGKKVLTTGLSETSLAKNKSALIENHLYKPALIAYEVNSD